MVKLATSHILLAIAACVYGVPAPTGTSTSSAAQGSPTVPYASGNPNYPLWNDTIGYTPEPIRGKLGANILGSHNVPIAKENPDLLAPPTTDNDNVHNLLKTGGWARQQNVNEMPIAKEIAGVNMKLWSYVLKGSMQVTAVNSDGQNYLATINAGDLWYFLPGVPHSLQATADDPEGAEFLLVFDNSTFNEGSTFLLADWLAHVSKEVVAKNFQMPISAFDHIPEHELYIFPSNPPPDNRQAVPDPYTYRLSRVQPKQLEGGTVKIVDSTTFKVSKMIAVAEVTVEPGAMRELHWHPNEPEWTFFLEGNARVTLFAAEANARTFDYQAGDIGSEVSTEVANPRQGVTWVFLPRQRQDLALLSSKASSTIFCMTKTIGGRICTYSTRQLWFRSCRAK
ncbi:Bicupin, oxalate decarboxylase/oxidase [Neolentinus lepideus HHB14362 ss-1]|uniref:Bicupin, oxalate decarboxylase/oxidase n=1 Tax=Neolentinus lepideus HHB14362 ss-1 TaxID=1314782 RepID=A0A165TZW9_9AGAM|nr:Bicupin, oxalate decarboxylase/oxidase [Neolentinus lepideus HHB14362 ss-1]